ncbi:protein of unknown function [Candidatus Nitrosocosmicus franklandus]|uniref:Uncharacterized protein n=1 Tax=Candidatus Nitrosocosmicus franklandianus TaxID=1798806 RepID=A0A484IFK6_9ARCH|nr:protein of unknown function [Candidatus Nitrosocosmicus franklandus]
MTILTGLPSYILSVAFLNLYIYYIVTRLNIHLNGWYSGLSGLSIGFIVIVTLSGTLPKPC